MHSHEHFMRRCLQLAAQGIRHVAPNPMVGAVVVHDGRIIGEGYHQRFGEGHAEVNAIASVRERELLPESTIYVSLEPCSFHGKTPPCADLLVKHRLKRVVVACLDPNPKVAGNGNKRLEAAGIEVISGVLEEEAKFLNRRFFTYHQQKRPYVILKWAQTLDGYIDRLREGNTPIGINWITAKPAQRLVHQWRAEEQAILVGYQTVVNDNPSLTVRHVDGLNPTRIVLDREGKLDSSAHVFDGAAPTLHLVDKGKDSAQGLDFSGDWINDLWHRCMEEELQSIIIEGGARTLQHFIEAGAWDEARVLVGDTTFGQGLAAPTLSCEAISTERIGPDQLLIYRK